MANLADWGGEITPATKLTDVGMVSPTAKLTDWEAAAALPHAPLHVATDCDSDLEYDCDAHSILFISESMYRKFLTV